MSNKNKSDTDASKKSTQNEKITEMFLSLHTLTRYSSQLYHSLKSCKGNDKNNKISESNDFYESMIRLNTSFRKDLRPLFEMMFNHSEYTDINGKSIEQAIHIETTDYKESYEWEYSYLQLIFGEQGTDWTLEKQSLIEKNGKTFDKMDLKLSKNTKKTFYFDVTDRVETIDKMMNKMK